ncbi:MAG: hypothetical protein JNM74_01960 [Myxococcales bacterium]|nr:hypothetical protein [Myxococcales bacterium]
MNRRSLSIALALVATVSAVAACSAEAEPEEGTDEDFAAEKPVALRSGGSAKKMPQVFSDEVEVLDESLVVPSNGATRAVLDGLSVGMVIAGNRDARTADLRLSKNPSGYLRKIVSITPAGDKVEIRTKRATLNELIDQGDLVFSSASPVRSIFDDAPENTAGVTPKGPTGASVGSGETKADTKLESLAKDVAFAPVVTFSNTKMALGAKVDGKIQLRRAFGVPLGVQRANLSLDLDPSFAADVEYGVRATSAQSQAGGSLDTTWQGPSVPIPVGGPIPLTVRLRPEIGCRVTLKGEVTVTTHVELRGHAAAAFDYRGGLDLRSTSKTPTLEASQRFVGVRGKAGLSGECAIQGVVSLLAFDSIGIEAKLGPFSGVTAEACVTSNPSGGFVLYEKHGLRAEAQGRIQIPGLGTPVLTKPLFGFKPVESEPFYASGDATTCALTP